MCFVRVSEQTVTFDLYIIKRLVFIPGGKCSQRGTDWVFKYSGLRFGFRRVNLLKPTGYVMHHQFNIQQLYALPTLYLCVLDLSENKQRLVPLTA